MNSPSAQLRFWACWHHGGGAAARAEQWEPQSTVTSAHAEDDGGKLTIHVA